MLILHGWRLNTNCMLILHGWRLNTNHMFILFFQLNIREEEVQRLNAKNKELQQEIRTHLQELEDRDNKVS